jgi:hypothetical protein
VNGTCPSLPPPWLHLFFKKIPVGRSPERMVFLALAKTCEGQEGIVMEPRASGGCRTSPRGAGPFMGIHKKMIEHGGLGGLPPHGASPSGGEWGSPSQFHRMRCGKDFSRAVFFSGKYPGPGKKRKIEEKSHPMFLFHKRET